MAVDIFHRWIGTEPTNPITEEKLMMLKMRKLTEEAIVYYLKRSGKLIEKLSNEERCFFEWGKHKTPISGYPDAGIKLGNESVLVEVKTYYGGYQHSQIRIGKIKLSYLKQLAIYMYYFKIKRGLLLMVNQGTGERFEYDLYQKGNNEYHFICPDNAIEFSLKEVFARFEKIWVKNIKTKKEPKIEDLYKDDIEKINWDEMPSSVISKARNNKAVVGSWRVKYSDFKDMIVEKQGVELGYSDKEIKRIKELTAGYSTKTKNTIRFDPTKI